MSRRKKPDIVEVDRVVVIAAAMPGSTWVYNTTRYWLYGSTIHRNGIRL